MAKNIIMSSHRITDCSQFGIVWLSSYCNTVEYLRVFCYKSEMLAN